MITSRLDITVSYCCNPSLPCVQILHLDSVRLILSKCSEKQYSDNLFYNCASIFIGVLNTKRFDVFVPKIGEFGG